MRLARAFQALIDLVLQQRRGLFQQVDVHQTPGKQPHDAIAVRTDGRQIAELVEETERLDRLEPIGFAVQEKPLEQRRHVGAQMAGGRVVGETICGDAHGRQRFAPAAEFGIGLAEQADDGQLGGIAAPAEAQRLQRFDRIGSLYGIASAPDADRLDARAHGDFFVAYVRQLIEHCDRACAIAANRNDAHFHQSRVEAHRLIGCLPQRGARRRFGGGGIVQLERGFCQRELEACAPSRRMLLERAGAAFKLAPRIRPLVTQRRRIAAPQRGRCIVGERRSVKIAVRRSDAAHHDIGGAAHKAVLGIDVDQFTLVDRHDAQRAQGFGRELVLKQIARQRHASLHGRAFGDAFVGGAAC